jgi:isocitrate dehydrogenase (NAD+)
MSNAKALRPIPATLIPGDGIGPEITEAVVGILDALGAPFEWDRQVGGMAAIKEGGDPLPSSLIESIRRTKLALKGPLTTPVGGGFRSVNVRLREEFGLYANLRPAKTMIQGGRYENTESRPPFSRPSTDRRPTSRARALPIPSPCCSQQP